MPKSSAIALTYLGPPGPVSVPQDLEPGLPAPQYVRPAWYTSGMDGKKITTFEQWTQGYGDQDENGIDLSLIRENLKLTPLERTRRGDAARRRVLQILESGVLDTVRIAAGAERIAPSRRRNGANLKSLDARRAFDSLRHLRAIKRVQEEMGAAE